MSKESNNKETGEQEQQELFYKFSMFEQQIKELQRQIGAIEKGITELNSLNLELDELIGAKDREIFASIGKGIFIQAKILSESLNVDIGNGNFVKKSIPETKQLIQEQINKLEGIRKELENNLEQLGEQLTGIMQEVQEKEKEHEKED